MAIGHETEKAVALDALFKRQTVHGLSGVVGLYESLPDSLKEFIEEQVGAGGYSSVSEYV